MAHDLATCQELLERYGTAFREWMERQDDWLVIHFHVLIHHQKRPDVLLPLNARAGTDLASKIESNHALALSHSQ
jgi:hypothetical protein